MFKDFNTYCVNVYLLIPDYCPTPVKITSEAEPNAGFVTKRKKKKAFFFLNRTIHPSHLDGWQLWQSAVSPVIVGYQPPQGKVFLSSRDPVVGNNAGGLQEMHTVLRSSHANLRPRYVGR